MSGIVLLEIVCLLCTRVVSQNFHPAIIIRQTSNHGIAETISLGMLTCSAAPKLTSEKTCEYLAKEIAAMEEFFAKLQSGIMGGLKLFPGIFTKMFFIIISKDSIQNFAPYHSS